MDKRELQKLLNQPYKQENWKEIVQFVFPNVSLLSTPKEFPISNNKIIRFSQIGNVRLNDGKSLALFELLLADSVNIHRNRVELNNEISKYIDQENIHGVLSVFEQGGEDYRFTFSARSTEFDEEESDFVQRKTDTKRYTYVLGKNESCKTPADRFYALSEKKDEADIQAIQHAFSVERLSKEFFDRYNKQFDKFWKYIASQDELFKLFPASEKEKSELKIRDFTKKLLGRIVFLHFLQKKGWLGCPLGDSWGDGDKQFIYNLFKGYSDKKHFHSKCLSELFYNTLNLKRDGDKLSINGLVTELENTKVPYLNGGLFDSDETESRLIDFPEEYFNELLDFFGQYNFTIDENDSNDHEVGIDPEMLGHIFENLLEDNKDKGAYYTPKVVVKYMCQESLITYLKSKLVCQNNIKCCEAIEGLVRDRVAEHASDLDLIEAISQALYDVKICDPAIGSGAFPMGILNAIYKVVEELWMIQPDTVSRVWNISDVEWEPHLVKKNIIQHSIYGVDIESGAVDIARLRFWLALVVDETAPLPLPNLDYKIVQGNSLLESFEGIELGEVSNSNNDEATTGTLFSGKIPNQNESSIEDLMRKYFNIVDPDKKKQYHAKIDEHVLSHIHVSLETEKDRISKVATKLSNKIKQNSAQLPLAEQKIKYETTSKEAVQLQKYKEDLRSITDKEIELSKLYQSNDRPFFLWHLMFKNVFDKQNGFDIVIGNPPYIGEKGNKEIFHQVKVSKFGKKYYQRRMDYFYFFIAKGIELLKDEGVLTFITTNYWITASGAQKFLRPFIKENCSILKYVDFGEFNIFDSAKGQHNCIFLLSKDHFKEGAEVIKVESVDNKLSLSEILRGKKLNGVNRFISQEQEHLYGTNSNITFLPESEFRIINKIISESDSIVDDVCTVSGGLSSSADKVNKSNIKHLDNGVSVEHGDGILVLNKEELESLNLSSEENRFIKPYFKSTDIDRYRTKSNNSRYVVYATHVNANEIQETENLYRHLLKYEAILKNRSQDIELALAMKKGHWFVLTNGRPKLDFETIKIVCPYRTKDNKFGFNNESWYAGRDVYFLLEFTIPHFYLLGLLNSKLIDFWLKKMGKRKGDILELYPEPIKNIRLPKEDKDVIKHIDAVVSEIVTGKLSPAEISQREKIIDSLVYKLYNLEFEDIMVVDPSYQLNKEEFNSFKLEEL